MNLMDKNTWEDLLIGIDEGQVVPIVGRELLIVDAGDGPRPYHQIVAERLAADLKVDPTHLPKKDYETNDVVCAYDRFHGDHSEIDKAVVRIIKNLKVSIPEPLRQLAEIPKFQLFVSTTVDTLLEEAVAAVRGRPPVSVSFPPTSNIIDLDEKAMRDNGALVYQILGRVSSLPKFAVTEGQMVEQMHDFMTGKGRPDKLIDKLQQSHLLVLGVDFPDWLARFLLRLARDKALWDSRQMMEIFADSRSMQNEFAAFLSHFSPMNSHVYTEGTPVDFVRELNRMWFEKHPKSSAPAPRVSESGEQPAPMTGGAVFISYAREDRESAFNLADRLIARDLDVWVDRRLKPGDDFGRLIERHIRECCAFIPVISRNTQNDDDRYWRIEWNHAVKRAEGYFGTDRSFLFPVVVDDTPISQLVEVRRNTFNRSVTAALGGEPPDTLIQQLDIAQKAFRKQFARA
jgi:hypothetical protein